MPKEELELRECFVAGNTNIVQSNFLIERKQRLSLPATQLLYTLTGMINKDDEDLKNYKVDVTYFADLWGVDLKLAYQTVEDALDELRSKGIRDHSINPKTGKKVFTTVGFISFGRYEHGEGYATVRIEPELKPHYIALKNKFTRFSLNNILQLQENGGQVNAMRTYELLKQYQKKGKRKFAVKEYKEQLGLIVYNEKGKFVKEKYKGSTANLKKYVLDPAIEKINNSTDIEAEYRIIGRGSKAVIEFTIRANKKNFMAFSSESAKSESTDLTSEDEFIEDYNEDEKTDDLDFWKYDLSKEGQNLTNAQLLEIISLARTSDYIRNLPFHTPLLDREMQTQIYIGLQDKYTIANLKNKNSYYSFLRSAVKENWANIK